MDIARVEVVISDDNFDPGNPDFSDQEGAPLDPTARALSPASAETTLGRIAAATKAAHTPTHADVVATKSSRWTARLPALMGGDLHEFVPSKRIGPETSLPCATSVPFPGGYSGVSAGRRRLIGARVIGRDRAAIVGSSRQAGRRPVRDAPIGGAPSGLRLRILGRSFGAAHDSADVTRAVDRYGRSAMACPRSVVRVIGRRVDPRLRGQLERAIASSLRRATA